MDEKKEWERIRAAIRECCGLDKPKIEQAQVLDELKREQLEAEAREWLEEVGYYV